MHFIIIILIEKAIVFTFFTFLRSHSADRAAGRVSIVLVSARVRNSQSTKARTYYIMHVCDTKYCSGLILF